MYPYVHCNTIYNSQEYESILSSINEDDICVCVYIYMLNIYSAIKKRMKTYHLQQHETNKLLGEISQKERQIPYDFPYVEFKTKQTNKTETDS